MTDTANKVLLYTQHKARYNELLQKACCPGFNVDRNRAEYQELIRLEVTLKREALELWNEGVNVYT